MTKYGINDTDVLVVIDLQNSAEDARRCGFEVVVIEDACRGIDMGGSVAATRAALSSLGIPCITEEAIG